MSIPDEIANEVKERVRNPFIGTLCLLFALFNWRVFAHLLLSDSSVDERLEAIDKLELAIWQPIVSALVYVIIAPFLLAGIEWLRQYSTDVYIRVKRSQEPRLDLQKKLKADNLTLMDALQIVRPNAGAKLKDAVVQWKRVVMQYSSKHAKPTLSPEMLENFIQGFAKVDEAFEKLLGTPLDSSKSDPIEND